MPRSGQRVGVLPRKKKEQRESAKLWLRPDWRRSKKWDRKRPRSPLVEGERDSVRGWRQDGTTSLSGQVGGPKIPWLQKRRGLSTTKSQEKWRLNSREERPRCREALRTWAKAAGYPSEEWADRLRRDTRPTTRGEFRKQARALWVKRLEQELEARASTGRPFRVPVPWRDQLLVIWSNGRENRESLRDIPYEVLYLWDRTARREADGVTLEELTDPSPSRRSYAEWKVDKDNRETRLEETNTFLKVYGEASKAVLQGFRQSRGTAGRSTAERDGDVGRKGILEGRVEFSLMGLPVSRAALVEGEHPNFVWLRTRNVKVPPVAERRESRDGGVGGPVEVSKVATTRRSTRGECGEGVLALRELRWRRKQARVEKGGGVSCYFRSVVARRAARRRWRADPQGRKRSYVEWTKERGLDLLGQKLNQLSFEENLEIHKRKQKAKEATRAKAKAREAARLKAKEEVKAGKVRMGFLPPGEKELWAGKKQATSATDGAKAAFPIGFHPPEKKPSRGASEAAPSLADHRKASNDLRKFRGVKLEERLQVHKAAVAVGDKEVAAREKELDIQRQQRDRREGRLKELKEERATFQETRVRFLEGRGAPKGTKGSS